MNDAITVDKHIGKLLAINKTRVYSHNSLPTCSAPVVASSTHAHTEFAITSWPTFVCRVKAGYTNTIYSRQLDQFEILLYGSGARLKHPSINNRITYAMKLLGTVLRKLDLFLQRMLSRQVIEGAGF